MNKQRHFSLRVLLLLGIFSGYLPYGFAQMSSPTASDIVKRTMAAALAHCHSVTSDGVEVFTFESPNNDEMETIKSLGSAAVAPLSTYVQPKVDCGFGKDCGFAQLFALKFLTALQNPAALGAFQRAFAQDQWEETRVYALAGMFETSKTAAEPYVKAALEDKSPNVRRMAEGLWLSYQPHNEGVQSTNQSASLAVVVGTGPPGPQQHHGDSQATDHFQFKDETGGEGITKDGIFFSFHSYTSDDGVKLLTYIETFTSIELAQKALDEKVKEASSVSARGPKLDRNGKPIGERVVLTAEKKTQGEAESQNFVCWTIGSNLHWIESKSLKHALAFEKTLDQQ